MAEVHVSNIPYGASDARLLELLRSEIGVDEIISCEMKRDRYALRHKGYGFVKVSDEAVAQRAILLASLRRLVIDGRVLKINPSRRPVRLRPEINTIKLEGSTISMGCRRRNVFSAFWSIDTRCEIEIEFGNPKILIIIDYDRCNDYKLEFPFRYIQQVLNVVIKGKEANCSLLLEIKHVPHIFHRPHPTDIDELLGSWILRSDQIEEWPRAQKELPWARTVDFSTSKCMGQSMAYLIQFCNTSQDALCAVLRELEAFRIAPSLKTEALKVKKADPFATSQFLGHFLRLPQRYETYGQRGGTLFQLVYKLNQLVQLGTIPGLALSEEFYDKLFGEPPELALTVLQRLNPSRGQVCEDPLKWFKKTCTQFHKGKSRPISASVELDEGQMWVNRLMVTPTKVYCMGPEAEVSNRVTRQFMHVTNNFLRVTFVEEDFSNLPSSALVMYGVGKTSIYTRVLEVQKAGIKFQGRQYHFLAYSASQLREQSFWMFANTDSITADSIRSWMGDFLDIRNVAKCAARMGQCFSSSTKTLPVHNHELLQMTDIERNDSCKKYCFSDGIGQISRAFAAEVAAICGCSGIVPSAFQIRYGGYKGVVAVNPHLRAPFKLGLRPSMRKFNSTNVDLEVLKWTKPFPCYLNRQVVVLLSTLGIADEVFERKQHEVLWKLDELLNSRAMALEVLQIANSGSTHSLAMEMMKAGYSPPDEPFLRSLLRAFRASQLLNLRLKARILVTEGKCLMGCLDETATLNYGEAFVQISSLPVGGVDTPDLASQTDRGCVITGKIVVAKNPCLHPGDVRVLTARNVPRLRHMVNCIVFPQRGPRPHPNECSGSDLDGDLYFVSWDQELIPPVVDPPMDYTPPAAAEVDHPVTIEEIQVFLVDYMSSDNLGVISNAHLVHADNEDSMARDPKCQQLAKLFSLAVDFSKTGIPALIPPNLRPSKYPDFMEKDDKVSYKSTKILGKLYRSVRGVEENEATSSRVYLSTREEIVEAFDADLMVAGFEDYLDEADACKNAYDCKLSGLMNQFGIDTEAEAVSGSILKLHRSYGGKRLGEVRDRISLAVRSLRSEARSWFATGFPLPRTYNPAIAEDPLRLPEREEFSKASAWYYVTYHPDYLSQSQERQRESDNIHLLSFPWVMSDKLLAIKNRASARRRSSSAAFARHVALV